MLRIAVLSILLVVSYSANSAIITHNGYSLDTDTNIVTGGGLQWLQWDETVGMSIANALSANSGWRLATNSEMAGLLNSFDFGLIFDDDENTRQSIDLPWSISEQTDSRHFISLFGDTYEAGGGTYPNNSLIYSYAFFGADPDADGLHNVANVLDDAITVGNQSVDGNVTMNQDNWPETYSSQYTGVALVQEVPLPAAAWLFISAMGGLGILKRVRK